MNNRFGQELRSAPPQQEKERRYGSKEKQELTLKATTLATQSRGNGKAASAGSANFKCYRCSGPHAIWQCEIFKNASYEDRFANCTTKETVRVAVLHMGTFQDHVQRDFLVVSQDVERSTIPFFTLWTVKRTESLQQNKMVSISNQLFKTIPQLVETATTLAESNPSLGTESSTFAASRDSVPTRAVMGGQPRVCFKVVPVKVSGPGSNKHLMTYAFLDSGSDTTICLRSLVEELSLESEPTNFTLSTVNYQGKEHGHQTCLDIEALDGRNEVYSR